MCINLTNPSNVPNIVLENGGWELETGEITIEELCVSNWNTVDLIGGDPREISVVSKLFYIDNDETFLLYTLFVFDNGSIDNSDINVWKVFQVNFDGPYDKSTHNEQIIEAMKAKLIQSS